MNPPPPFPFLHHTPSCISISHSWMPSPTDTRHHSSHSTLAPKTTPTHHPFIIQLRYSFQTKHRLCFSSDFVNGGHSFCFATVFFQRGFGTYICCWDLFWSFSSSCKMEKCMGNTILNGTVKRKIQSWRPVCDINFREDDENALLTIHLEVPLFHRLTWDSYVVRLIFHQGSRVCYHWFHWYGCAVCIPKL